MRVCERAQRQLDPGWVNHILEDFDPDKMDTPHVSHRDGYFYIMDGQHSLEALKQWLGPGWEEQHFTCWVYEGLTEKDEAQRFRTLNNKKSIAAFAKYKTGITAESPVETDIERVVSAAGLVTSMQKVPGAIGGVGTLIRAYKRDGVEPLGRGLGMSYEAYGDSGLQSVIIDGFSMLCRRYNGSLDDTRAIKSLSSLRGGVNGLLGLAEQLRLKTGGRKAECVAASAVTVINRDRSGRAKLPSWFK